MQNTIRLHRYQGDQDYGQLDKEDQATIRKCLTKVSRLNGIAVPQGRAVFCIAEGASVTYLYEFETLEHAITFDAVRNPEVFRKLTWFLGVPDQVSGALAV